MHGMFLHGVRKDVHWQNLGYLLLRYSMAGDMSNQLNWND